MGTQIRFFKKPYRNSVKTAEAGTPVFDTVDYYEIRVLGEPDTHSGPWHRASPEVQTQWAAAYQAWTKDNATEGIIGTPLEQVPWLEAGEVETMRFAGIRTLENLANVADGSITRIPGGLALRKKAQDMLAAAKESAPVQRLSDELAKRDSIIADLQAQIREITAEKAKRRSRAAEE